MNKKGRPLSQSSLKRLQDGDLLQKISEQQPMTKTELEDQNTILKNMSLADDEVLMLACASIWAWSPILTKAVTRSSAKISSGGRRLD